MLRRISAKLVRDHNTIGGRKGAAGEVTHPAHRESYEVDEEDEMKKFWIAFALGAVAGTVAALLYAPESGASTRRKLRRGIEDIGDNLTDAADYLREQAERIGKEAQRLIDSSKGQFNDAMDAAQQYAKSASSKAEDTGSRLM